MATNKAELDNCEGLLQQFRVNELHILLSTFKYPKLGKKNELVQRCLALLHNARNQGAVMHKIREISSSRRYYTTPISPSLMSYNGSINGASLYHQSQSQQMQPSSSSNSMNNPFQPSSHSFMGHTDRAKGLRIVDLPFYDRELIILDLTELPANVSGIRSLGRQHFKFAIPPDVVPRLCYRSESTPLPRPELQLRFFLLDHSSGQNDDFPPNCAVKINDLSVTLPNVIPTNKPNIEPKRPSRPVNITPYCQPSRDTSRGLPHNMSIEWTADKRGWAVGIYLVTRVTSDILLRRLMLNANARRDANATKRTIRNRLTGNDDDSIEMDSIKISLLCPLGKTRMVIPVKGSDCTHLQCFDLSLFLMMNEKRPTWKCAVCDSTVPYSKIIIDGYFEQMLREIGPNITDVELLLDGGWRPVVEQVESVSDDEDIQKNTTPLASAFGSKLPVVASTPNFPSSAEMASVDDDVIVLGDSDDEDDRTVSSSRIQVSSPIRSDHSDQSIVCIELDESDSADHTPLACAQTSTRSAANSCSSLPIPPVPCSSFSSVTSHMTQPSANVWYGSNAVSSSQASLNATTSHMPTNNINPLPAALFNPFEHFNGYRGVFGPPSDYGSMRITEELRTFMANIQHSTNSNPPFRYS